MSPEGRLQHHFEESLAIKQASLSLINTIIDAAGIMSRCILNDGKILSCGNGSSANMAQYFCANLLSRFEMERPGLPALALTPVNTDLPYEDMLAKQVRALAQPGDVLLTITTADNGDRLLRAIQAAHERKTQVIALTGDDGHMSALLSSGDVEIRAPSIRAARIHEVHLLAVHCLCDLIDHEVLGIT